MDRNFQFITILGLAAQLTFAQPTPSTPPVPPSAPVPAAWPDVRVLNLSNRSYLGVNVKELDSNRVKELKLREEHGVEVTQVEDDTPAGKAGLKVGDVVQEYNGQRIEGTEQFVRMVRETPVGRQVKLGVNRQGTSMTMVATIAQRSNKVSTNSTALRKMAEDARRDAEKIRDRVRDEMQNNMPRAYMGWSNGQLGVEAESLSDQLASYFGVKEGVLVRSVKKSSAAEKAGVKAGDVIVKVDSTKVATPKEIATQLRAVPSKKTIQLQLFRDRKEVSLDVTLPVEDMTRGSSSSKARTVRSTPPVPANKDQEVE